MAWQRGGDTGATYPPLMAVRGDPKSDERTVNEVAGWLWRLSLQSAAHLTDYVVDVGTVELFGGPRTPELVRLALKHGLLSRVRTPNGAAAYKIVEDPDFIHLRSRAEVEWERQQRNDTRYSSNAATLIAVLRRDGDQCRWCGIGVVWLGRKTKRSAEWDHLVPGQAGTVDTMVVACRACNAARGGDVERWDSAHTLRPAPDRPRYGAHTARRLTENGYPTEPTDDDVRPAPAPGADPAPPRGVRPATGTGDDPAPAPGPEVPPEVDEKSLPRSDRTTLAGSGRVGSGPGSDRSGRARDGTGRDPTPPTPAARRRRGRRGGKRTTSPGGGQTR